MILSAYERKDSPFVHVQFTGHDGRKQCRKTAIRKDDPLKSRKVALALNKLEGELLNSRSPVDEGWLWVLPYLRTRYSAKRRTLAVYEFQWRNLRVFMDEYSIDGPSTLDRSHCFDYVHWRTKAKPKISYVTFDGTRRPNRQRAARTNTAIGELKLLGLVMDEAVARNYALSNPARRLKIEREAPHEKPAISDAEILHIYTELRSRPT